MLRLSSLQSIKPRVITVDGRIVGIQVDADLMVRMYLQSTTPQRFGVRVVRELPEILKMRDARRALNIPNFDSVVIRETTHSPLEADLTLLHNKNVVGRYSVKATPTSNIDYVINSWRREHKAYDLIAIIPLEGRKDGESLFFVAIILVPKYLKNELPAKIKQYIYDVIEAKRIEEKLDRLWLTDFAEISNTVRYLSIAKKQDEMLKRQDEMLRKQDEMLRVLKEILKVLKDLRDKINTKI